MAPLVIHLTSFLLLYLARSFLRHRNTFFSFTLRAESISIGILFICTGIAHFLATQSMIGMFPEFIPYKKEFVFLSGIFEILAGVSLVLGRGRQEIIGGALILFLILALPFNIYSAVSGSGMGAHGVSYLWFRIPLQVFWITWIWFFIVRRRYLIKGLPAGSRNYKT